MADSFKREDNNIFQFQSSYKLKNPYIYSVSWSYIVSGVIAVVTTGLIVSRHRNKFSEQTNIQFKSAWDTGVFILSGLVFILIGLEFPHVLENISSQDILPLIGCAFLIFLVALIIRMAVIFWHKINTKRQLLVLRKRINDPQFKAAIIQRGSGISKP